jgi:hypothetical protein
MLTLEDFTRGRKFRVIKPECSLVGWMSNGGFGTGYRQHWEEIVMPLAVGCVLTCNGPGSDRHASGCAVTADAKSCNGAMKRMSGRHTTASSCPAHCAAMMSH